MYKVGIVFTGDKDTVIKILNDVCAELGERIRFFKDKREVLHFIKDYFLSYEIDVRKRFHFEYRKLGNFVLVIKKKKVIGKVRIKRQAIGYFLDEDAFREMDYIFENQMEVLQ